MTAPGREELISAYLDDELSEAERAEVERLLAENSQMRRLHAELVALRAGIQSLPQHKLDHDISGAVLRRAEQAVLRGGDSPPEGATLRPAADSESFWMRGAGWRRVIWPALAVAAALAILIYDANRRPAEREIARTQETDEMASTPDALGTQEQLLEPSAASSKLSDEAAGATREMPHLLERNLDADADNMPRHAPALELRAREQEPESLEYTMPKRAAAPAAGGMPAPRAAARSVPGVAPPAATQAGDDLVLECTPEFLRNKEFEKLLDEKKIAWRRVDPAATRGERKAETEALGRSQLFAQSAQQLPPGSVTYIIGGTPEQVKQALNFSDGSARWLVEADARDRKSDQDRADPSQLAEQDALSSQSAARALGRKSSVGCTVTLIAPLKQPAAPAPAEPADTKP